MIDSLIYLDQELMIFLNNLGNNNWDLFWLIVTDKKTSIVFYLLLLILCWQKSWKKIGTILLFGILLITFSDQIANLFKYSFKRLRPCHDPNIAPFITLVKDGCGRKYGFFSAHASTGIALATYFGLILKSKFKYSLYFLLIIGVFVGYSRIYLGVHFPLDVLTGFIIGGTLGAIAYKLLNFTFDYFKWYKK